MEELKNSLLDRINVQKSRVGYKNVLDCYSEVVLERLSRLKDDKILEKIIKDLRDLIENKVNTNDELLLMMIEIIDNRNGLDNYYYYDIIFSRKMDIPEKIECLNKTLKVTKEFQIDYIYKIYENNLIPYKDLASDIILDCKYEEQTLKIYDMFSSIETLEEQEFMPIFLEVSKIMQKIVDEDVLDAITEIAEDENLLKTGYTIKVVEMLTKCKTYEQLSCIYYLFNDLDVEVIPYAYDSCKYFLMTKDDDILNNLFAYIKHNLKQKLPITLDNINLIISARHKFNGKYIIRALNNEAYIKNNEAEVMAEVFSDSIKEYQPRLIQESFKGFKSDLRIGSSMLVNESETEKKATKIANTLNNLAIFDRINETSLAFMALVNRVYTDVEINLIANLAMNPKLNNIGVALPLARIIALEEEEFDEFLIWNAYQNEEDKKEFIEGIASLYKLTLPEHLKKTEKIINNILKGIINATIIYEEEKEPDLSIASKNLRKILEKRDKNAKR